MLCLSVLPILRQSTCNRYFWSMLQSYTMGLIWNLGIMLSYSSPEIWPTSWHPGLIGLVNRWDDLLLQIGSERANTSTPLLSGTGNLSTTYWHHSPAICLVLIGKSLIVHFIFARHVGHFVSSSAINCCSLVVVDNVSKSFLTRWLTFLFFLAKLLHFSASLHAYFLFSVCI